MDVKQTGSPAQEQQSNRLDKSQYGHLTVLLFLILAYPLISMLWHHDYPVFSAEIGLILACFALLAGLLSMLLQYVRSAVANLLVLTVLTLAFLIQFNPLFVGLIAIVASGLIMAFSLGKHFQTLLMPVVIALIIGAFIDSRIDRAGNSPEQVNRPQESAKGTVIHILLDGFIGADGLPGFEASQSLRSEMMAFFEEYGFQLHTRAYSHYSSTIDTMTRAMNFRNDDENIFQRTVLSHEPLSIGENAWFKALREYGYPVSVYQTESMDFCDAEPSVVSSCNVFPIPNLKSIHTGVSHFWARAPVLLRTLIRQSLVISMILKRSGEIDLWGVSTYDERMLEELARDIRIRPGGAHFAHILLPHPPLVYRRDCTLDYESETWLRFTANYGRVGNSEKSQYMRYEKYAENAKCALAELGALFKTLKDAGLYEQATIVVHGDHGGSLYLYAPSIKNTELMSFGDLRESYSVLFAVKYPHGKFSVDEQTVSLNVLMARTIAGITGLSQEQLGISVLSEDKPFIYMSYSFPLTRKNVDIFSE